MGGSKKPHFVIPANAGISYSCGLGDSCIRRNYHAGSGTKKHEISLYKPSEVCQTSEGYKDYHRNDTYWIRHIIKMPNSFKNIKIEII